MAWRKALMAIPDFRVVGSAASGQELLDKLRNQPADVVLMDLEMPGLDGLGAIRQLPPNQRCIVVSMHDTDQAREQASKAGASGFLLEGRGPARSGCGDTSGPPRCRLDRCRISRPHSVPVTEARSRSRRPDRAGKGDPGLVRPRVSHPPRISPIGCSSPQRRLRTTWPRSFKSSRSPTGLKPRSKRSDWESPAPSSEWVIGPMGG